MFKANLFGKEVWLYLGVFFIDILLRIATLVFWAFDIQDFPQMPIFTKGVKFPEIVSLMLLMEIIVLVGFYFLNQEYGRFKILIALCLSFGLVSTILSMFYSHNVAGSALLFIFFAMYLRRVAYKNQLIAP